MKRYNEYFISCLKWNKQLPIHWKLLRLKRILQERKENNFPVKTNNILSLTNVRGVIPYSQKGNIGNKSKENMDEYHISHINDLVMNSMNVVIGSVGVSKYYGAISPVYYALFPRGDENIRYIEYIFKLPTFEETLKGLGNGILDIRKRIPMLKLNDVLLPIPPREEQDKIVHFLDWKVSAINRLINIRKKEIGHITEIKKTIISNTVTHGLNSNVEMKDSNVSWIGKIPKHWKIIRGKMFFYNEKQLNTGDICSNVLSLTLKGVINNSKEHPIGLSPKDYSTYQIFDKDNLVFKLIDLENISTSRVGLVHERGIMSSAYIRLINRYDCNMKYFYFQYYERYLRNIYNGLGAGVRSTLNVNDLLNLFVYVPPREEQDKIVRFLESKIMKFDNAIDVITKKINFLQELKNRIISDAVTGQIDVRNISIPEYEQTEEIVDNDVEDIEEKTDSLMLEKE